MIVTEWNQFRALDLNRLAEAMAQPVIVDLRKIYRREEALRCGFRNVNVGEGVAFGRHEMRVAAE